MSRFVPFIAVAAFETAPLLHDTLSTDGLLTLVAARRTGSSSCQNPSGFVDLPLAARDGVWQAGCAHFRTGPTGVDTYIHTVVRGGLRDLTNIEGVDYGDPAKFDKSSSYVTNRMNTYQGVIGLTQVILPMVGDPAAVADLLSDVDHLGVQANSGCGAIGPWTIKTVDADPDTFGFVRTDGRPARSLPIDLWHTLGGGATDVSGGRISSRRRRIIPPYWAEEDRVQAVAPHFHDTVITDPTDGDAILALLGGTRAKRFRPDHADDHGTRLTAMGTDAVVFDPFSC